MGGCRCGGFCRGRPCGVSNVGMGWVPEETDADKDYSDDGGDEEVED